MDNLNTITNALSLKNSRHTNMPAYLLYQPEDHESTYKEPDPVPLGQISSKPLMEFKIHAYKEEEELPNFYNATNALHYFRVLRDLMFNWVRA